MIANENIKVPTTRRLSIYPIFIFATCILHLKNKIEITPCPGTENAENKSEWDKKSCRLNYSSVLSLSTAILKIKIGI